MAPDTDQGFTEAEFFDAYRFVLPEAEARVEAQRSVEAAARVAAGKDMQRMGRDVTVEHQRDTSRGGSGPEPPVSLPRPVAFTNAARSSYSDDVLILLSFVSEATRLKVDRYRAERRAAPPPAVVRQRRWQEDRAAEEREWQARHTELKQLLDRGLLPGPPENTSSK